MRLKQGRGRGYLRRTLTEEKGLWAGTAGYEPHCLPGGRA